MKSYRNLHLCSPPWGRWPSVLWLRPATRPWTSRGSSPSRVHWTAAFCTNASQWEENSASKLYWTATGANSCFSQLPSFHAVPVKEGRHLLVGHEFDGRLRGDLQHVDAVPSPQGRGAALFQHLLEAADQADLVALGRVHLHKAIVNESEKWDIYSVS